MAEAGDILVVGGYGVIGRRIAAHLARLFPRRVIVAGRDESRANAVCGTIGGGARTRIVDVDDRRSVQAALDGVGTVITCVTQKDRHVLQASVERGLAYTDTAAEIELWEAGRRLAAQASRSGARVVLGAGLIPGISNVLARKLADRLGNVERIETAVLLGLGDQFGPDSLGFIARAARKPFTVIERGRFRRAAAFSEGWPVEFPAPIGFRTAYLFPWVEAVFYPETLGARTAVGRLTLDPPWVGRLVFAVLRRRAGRWLSSPAALDRHRGAIDWLQRRLAGRDCFAVAVSAESGGQVVRGSLLGRQQAAATAASAAQIARSLVTGRIATAGVSLPEQVVEPEPFFEALTTFGYYASIEGPHPVREHVIPNAEEGP